MSSLDSSRVLVFPIVPVLVLGDRIAFQSPDYAKVRGFISDPEHLYSGDERRTCEPRRCASGGIRTRCVVNRISWTWGSGKPFIQRTGNNGTELSVSRSK
jgi:hypothetical protein